MVFGVFIILIAGLGLYLYKTSSALMPAATAPLLEPTRRPEQAVVGAAIDINSGTLISDTDTLLEMKNISGDEYAANQNAYFTNIDDLRNMKALSKLKGNEAIRRSDVGPAGLALKIPAAAPGEQQVRAFPIQVNNMSGVAGLIEPGDFIDVMASFNLDVTTFRPGVPQQSTDSSDAKPLVMEQASNEGTVKVLLQDVQVLDVMKPPAVQPTADGSQAPPPPQETAAAQSQSQAPVSDAGTTLQSGNWIMIIGVTDQEAETLRFALDRGIGISTLLRRADDHTTQHTVGSTIRILIDQYGMPVPSSMPPAQQAGPVQIPNVPSLPEEQPEKWAPVATPEAAK